MKRPQNLLGRQYDSSGPEGKVRGTALQLYERYKTAAREAQGPDRILAEAYFQFADHYYRLAVEAGAFEPEPQVRRDTTRPDDDSTGNRFMGQDGSDSADGADEPMMADAGEGRERREPREPRPDRRPGPQPEPRPERTPDQQPSLLFSADTTRDPDAPSPVVREAAPADDTAVSEQTSEAAPKPRRRGRPRKVDSMEKHPDARSADDVSSSPREPGTAKAKADKVTADEQAAEAPTSPRRRGRPRKNPAPAPADEVPA